MTSHPLASSPNAILDFITSNREALDLVTDLLPIPVFVKDRQGRYIDCNRAFKDFLAFSREQIIGKTAHEIWRKEEADVFHAQDQLLFAKGGLQVYETRITGSEGATSIVQFHKQVFCDDSGAAAGFLGVIFDITEKKRLELDLSRLASIDELTGLLNRREGMARLEAMHKHSDRKNRPYCLAMLDLDHFKRLNDRHGHLGGDQVLRQFSAMLRDSLRSSDILLRFGGEEFVVALPETEQEDGRRIMERLRSRLQATPLMVGEGQAARATVSIGIAQCPGDGGTVGQLIHASDQALYEAKNSGRNRVVCANRS